MPQLLSETEEPLPFSVSYFQLLQSSTNQELYENHLSNQGSYYEKYR